MPNNEITMTLRPIFDTEYLEIQRAYHLRAAQQIQETIEQLSRCREKADDEDE